MPPGGEDSTSLRSALAAVERRLAARTRARVAASTAAALLVPAWLVVPGAIGAAAIAIGAVAAGGLVRPAGGRAAAWLDRHGADDDLMISGAAVADGRVATALADDVVIAADARMATARRPSPWPAAASLAAIAAVALIVAASGGRGRHPSERGVVGDARDGRRVLSAVPADDDVAGADDVRDRDAVAGAVIIGGPRDPGTDGAAGDREPGAGEPGERDRAAAGAGAGSAGHGPGGDRTDPGGGGTGSGAGDRGAVRPAIDPAGPGGSGATAGSASGALLTSAPQAGARADVVGVPPRYRELVLAYLAQGPEPAR